MWHRLPGVETRPAALRSLCPPTLGSAVPASRSVAPQQPLAAHCWCPFVNRVFHGGRASFLVLFILTQREEKAPSSSSL